MFDDGTKHIDIKNTDDMRYAGYEEILTLTKDSMIDNWNTIFKNKTNKRQFKKIFIDHVMQICGNHMKEHQCIYFNGTFENGQVWRAKRLESGYCQLELMENLTLSVGESDVKIFELSQRLQLDGQQIEILSLDTDVKMLALYWSTKFSTEYVIRSGTSLVPAYFYPKIMIDSIKNQWGEVGNIEHYIGNLLFIYGLFGCDYNPTFYGISHAFAMRVFEHVNNSRVFNSSNDFLWLILDVYETKNKTLKKMFSNENERETFTVDDCILKTRGAIKSVRGSDQQTIPLPSVLRLQIRRTELIKQFWTGCYESYDPSLYGYYR